MNMYRNLTTLPDEIWAERLASSYERAAEKSTNKFIAEWYRQQAELIRDENLKPAPVVKN